MNEEPIFTTAEAEEILRGSNHKENEALVLNTITKHPKRRGELRAEYTRRILRLAREASK